MEEVTNILKSSDRLVGCRKVELGLIFIGRKFNSLKNRKSRFFKYKDSFRKMVLRQYISH